MLIVVEGADGCGKSSVAEGLAKRVGAKVISFPNDKGVTGPMIREYLKGCWSIRTHLKGDGPIYAEVEKKHGALAFQALQVANRMEVMPALMDASMDDPECPKIILARYWQSAWVYGQMDGLDPAFLVQVHIAMAEPHMNFLLDISPREAMKRREARDGELPPERYEGKLDFTTRVVDLYRGLWSMYDMENKWAVVDATKPIEQVIDNCYQLLKARRIYGEATGNSDD